MIKVLISPPLHHAPYGIRRVIEALHRHLPEYGVQVVETEAEADVVHVHGTAFVETRKPTVYTSHGMYWADHEWPHEFLLANHAMAQYMKRATVITAVSHWVATALRRGVARPVFPVRHGIEADEFRPGANPHRGFVLWNKARADIVSNPADMQRLAEMLPDVGFVTTIGEKRPNVQVLGVVSHEVMRDVLQQAGVYLSTARETFGIGTLEALACGVPVVGWDWGGNREIVTHGRDGLLATPGDYETLGAYVRQALADQEMRRAARATAETWGWGLRVGTYAELYKLALFDAGPRPTAVSVVVTAHNLGRYLEDCLASVQAQGGDWECLVVDDQSTDETPEIYAKFADDGRFHYIRTPENLKLSGARNFGIERAVGRYILPLDADDMLAAGAVETLAAALDADPGLHIAYGHLDVVDDAGNGRRRNDWPFERFDWYGQMSHLNQLPYSAMYRRDVWKTTGGYRTRDWRAEDAAFWCRATSMGWTAQKVTQQTTLIYRMRNDSKSAQERAAGHSDGDWTSWYPWRIAGSVEDGLAARKEGRRPDPALVPFGAQGDPGQSGCWPVWSHHDPLVSVVIPVGPGHGRYVLDAVDSVAAQSFPFWECIVVDNTLVDELESVNLPSWARVVFNPVPGIASTRNAGLDAAGAPLVLFLDADDMLTPNALRDLVTCYVESDGRYAYGDWVGVSDKVEFKSSKDYDRFTWAKEGLHPVTCLIPTEWARDVGGFDDSLPGWEDWDFFIKLTVAGYCGARTAVPTMIYRMHAGQRREQSLEDSQDTLPILRQRYADYFEGRRQMAGCCGGNGTTILEAKRRLNMLDRPQVNLESGTMADGTVRIEYTGDREGGFSVSRVSGTELTRTYKLGANPVNRYHNADPGDAKLLAEAGLVRIVQRVGGPSGGVDYTQAAVPKPSIQPFAAPVQEPEPAEKPAPFDPDEVVSGTVAELKERIIGLQPAQLRQVRAAESAGSGRKSALAAIDALLEESQRVG